jgi:hypothetical protein
LVASAAELMKLFDAEYFVILARDLLGIHGADL